MIKIRIFLIFLTLIVVGSVGLFVSYYARGYQFDFKTLQFLPNGILVIKSDPVGAEIYVNGTLKGATDTTLSLPPGTYDIGLKKDAYFTWNKRMIIDKEVVTQAQVSLYRSAPSLTAITFTGSIAPIASDDYTRIAYGTTDGLYTLETYSLPLGFSKDPRQITDADVSSATWAFSPSGRQIMLTTKNSVFLLDTSTFTPQAKMVNIASQKDDTLTSWAKERQAKITASLSALPLQINDELARKTNQISFSPDDTKILYTASAAGTLNDGLVAPLPGSSTQKQNRAITPGNTYVYDIKEDRNFLVSTDSNQKLSWFPNSKNLVLAENNRVIIMDYDGTNPQAVYSGSYISPYAFPFGSTGNILILSNLGGGTNPSNLYSLSLK
jgi:hypothetical protein